MRVLVDTNILLRSAQPNHPLCYQATHAVSKLLRQSDSVDSADFKRYDLVTALHLASLLA
jgi:hypothetical protein